MCPLKNLPLTLVLKEIWVPLERYLFFTFHLLTFYSRFKICRTLFLIDILKGRNKHAMCIYLSSFDGISTVFYLPVQNSTKQTKAVFIANNNTS